MITLNSLLSKKYEELYVAICKYHSGEINKLELKKVTAFFGIYQEKDNKFEVRIRCNGGEVSVEKLKNISKLMKEFAFEQFHLTTRQDIQLHAIAGEKLKDFLYKSAEYNIIFKGGGGNTIRNITIPVNDDVYCHKLFSVKKIVDLVWQKVFDYEKAFEFARKLKISFDANGDEDSVTTINDFGFYGVIKDGKYGFRVFGGGGLGRGAKPAIVVKDFLELKDLYKAVFAGIDLFYDHGDRENRAKARLRFIRDKIGDQEFVSLFNSYFTQSTQPDFELSPKELDLGIDYYIEDIPKDSINIEYDNEVETIFKSWEKYFVHNTYYKDFISLYLPIKKGVLTVYELDLLIKILEKYKIKIIGITNSQDVLIPLVHKKVIKALFFDLYNNFLKKFFTKDIFFNIVSCVGAQKCSIGLLDSRFYSNQINSAISRAFRKVPFEECLKFYQEICTSIRISGCDSSCSLNQIALLGFSGIKKQINGSLIDAFKVYIGGSINVNNSQLGKHNDNWWISAKNLENFVYDVFIKFLDEIKNYKSLKDFFYSFKEKVNDDFFKKYQE